MSVSLTPNTACSLAIAPSISDDVACNLVQAERGIRRTFGIVSESVCELVLYWFADRLFPQ